MSETTTLLFSRHGRTHRYTLDNFHQIQREPPQLWELVNCYTIVATRQYVGEYNILSDEYSFEKVTKHRDKIQFKYDSWSDQSERSTDDFTLYPLVVVHFAVDVKFGDSVTEAAYNRHKFDFQHSHLFCAQFREFDKESKLTNLRATKYMSTAPEFNTNRLTLWWLLAVIAGLNWFFLKGCESPREHAN